MSDELNGQTTQSFEGKLTARFDRLEGLVISLSHQLSALQATVNEIAQNQRDMYVDLRGRDKIRNDKIEIMRREI